MFDDQVRVRRAGADLLQDASDDVDRRIEEATDRYAHHERVAHPEVKTEQPHRHEAGGHGQQVRYDADQRDPKRTEHRPLQDHDDNKRNDEAPQNFDDEAIRLLLEEYTIARDVG